MEEEIGNEFKKNREAVKRTVERQKSIPAVDNLPARRRFQCKKVIQPTNMTGMAAQIHFIDQQFISNPPNCRKWSSKADAVMLKWLEFFRRKGE